MPEFTFEFAGQVIDVGRADREDNLSDAAQVIDIRAGARLQLCLLGNIPIDTVQRAGRLIYERVKVRIEIERE